MSTTFTYFVVELSVAVTTISPSHLRLSLFLPLRPLRLSLSLSSPLASSPYCPSRRAGFIVLDEIAIVIAIILFLLLLLCTSIRDVRCWR